MALIGEERILLEKSGGRFVPRPIRIDGRPGLRAGSVVRAAAAAGALLLAILILFTSRGLPLRDSFHNQVAGHVIRYPKGWLAGYGRGKETRIWGQIKSDAPTAFLFQRLPLERFGLISGSPDPLPEIAGAIAREHGFRVRAERYRVRPIRFMMRPGILIQGPAGSGWGWLIVALDGAAAQVLLMTTSSLLAARSLEPTWRRIIGSCRQAEIREVEEAPPWE